MSVAVETVIALPMLMLLVAAVVYGARYEMSRQAVGAAAAEGARAASIARTMDEARTSARHVASATLSDMRCVSSAIEVNAAGLNRPIGTPAAVSVTVRCTVSQSDVAILGVPGTITFTATRSSPVDAYRGR